jgi:hypothetical protein
MNGAMQIAAEDVGQVVNADDQAASDSAPSRIVSILLKVVLVTAGVGIGGFIGLIIAFATGLLEFRC